MSGQRTLQEDPGASGGAMSVPQRQRGKRKRMANKRHFRNPLPFRAREKAQDGPRLRKIDVL